MSTGPGSLPVPGHGAGGPRRPGGPGRSSGSGSRSPHRAVLTDSLDESLRRPGRGGRRRLRGRAAGGRSATCPATTSSCRSSTRRCRWWPRRPGSTAAALVDRDARQDDASATATCPTSGPARVLAAPVGGATIYVAGTPRGRRGERRPCSGTSLLVAVPLSAAVLAGLVWWLVGRVLRPVDAIRAEVDRISASRLDRRVPEPPTRGRDRPARAHDERHARPAAPGPRSGSAASWPTPRTSCAARSPASGPSSRWTRRTRRRPTSRPPTPSVLAQTVALQRLVDDLLLLARADSGALQRGSAGPVDLDDVVLEVLRAPWRPARGCPRRGAGPGAGRRRAARPRRAQPGRQRRPARRGADRRRADRRRRAARSSR